jgi:hypothetical protein
VGARARERGRLICAGRGQLISVAGRVGSIRLAMTRRGSPLRILAPLALVGFGVALVLIISSGGGGGGGGKGGAHAAEKARDLGPTVGRRIGGSSRRTRTTTTGQLPQTVYIVKTGDTLGGISQKTGVPITKLQDLNPGLDPSGLQTGQRIKLR